MLMLALKGYKEIAGRIHTSLQIPLPDVASFAHFRLILAIFKQEVSLILALFCFGFCFFLLG